MQTGISNAQLNSAIVYTLRNVAFFLDGWRRGQSGVQMIYGKHRLRVHTNAACWAVAQTHSIFWHFPSMQSYLLCRKEAVLMKDKNLHIRISNMDYEIIREKASTAKSTVTEYVLKCCLNKQIFVIEGLDEVLRQQKYIGNNLNQLTRLANSGAITVVGLTEMVDVYSQVSHKLNELLERKR